jgi:hypothetical protein
VRIDQRLRKQRRQSNDPTDPRYDGQWSGTTSQGTRIGLTVSALVRWTATKRSKGDNHYYEVAAIRDPIRSRDETHG